MSDVWERLRGALKAAVGQQQAEAQMVVRRQTRTADARADALIRRIEGGAAAGWAETITDDQGRLLFMLDASTLDGPDVLG